MTKRQRQVAIAAGPVFLGRGFARTTMGDVAAAAGLSRQGLYLAFSNKEAVFAAAVLVLSEAQHAVLDEGLRTLRGLRPRLVFVCENWLAGAFDLKQSTPDAADMDDLAFPVVRQVYQRFVELVAGLIEEAARGALAPVDVADLARIVVFGVRGYSATARDGADIRRLVATQIDLVVGHVEEATVGRPVDVGGPIRDGRLII